MIPSAARCWRTGFRSAAATESASTPSFPGTWESPAAGSPVRWHTGDPETDPWEWRMRVLEERDDVAYAKLFFRTSGYIVWPLYPLFYAVRRRGESLEEAYRRGTVSGAAKRIYDVLAASGGVALHDLKLLGRFSKGEKSAFDRALTDLQSRMFITVCGREQKRDKNGRAYGWSSTVFTTVEDFWAVRGKSLGEEEPERAYAVLLGAPAHAPPRPRAVKGGKGPARLNAKRSPARIPPSERKTKLCIKTQNEALQNFIRKGVNAMKKALSAFLSLLLLAFVFPSPPASAADGVSFTLTVDALEADAASGRVTAYLSDADAPRVIPAERFNFRNASLLIFDADGRLVERAAIWSPTRTARTAVRSARSQSRRLPHCIRSRRGRAAEAVL